MSRTIITAGRAARGLALWACLAATGALAQQDDRQAAFSAAAAMPDAATAEAAQPPPAPAQLQAVRIRVPVEDPRLAGLTGLHTADGRRAVAITNFGWLIEGGFERDGAGRLTGFRLLRADPLTFPGGRALTNGFRAAEGLAVARDGRLFVSFEYHTRVWTYRGPGADPQDLGAHDDFQRLPNGRGLASLALGPDGAIYAIPERPARMTHGFPSYRWQDGVWHGSFRMPSSDRFLPVGADFGPDGWLYVLEHEGSASGGRSQIRRFAVQGDRMGRGQVLMRSAPGEFGYLSSLSVWRDGSGRLRATLLADSGAAPGQPAEFVEVVLPR